MNVDRQNTSCVSDWSCYVHTDSVYYCQWEYQRNWSHENVWILKTKVGELFWYNSTVSYEVSIFRTSFSQFSNYDLSRDDVVNLNYLVVKESLFSWYASNLINKMATARQTRKILRFLFSVITVYWLSVPNLRCIGYNKPQKLRRLSYNIIRAMHRNSRSRMSASELRTKSTDGRPQPSVLFLFSWF